MSQEPPQPAPPAEPDAAEAERRQNLTEAEAIAAAMLIGERMRREQNAGVYFYTRRIGAFGAALSFAGLLLLLTYSRLDRDFSPFIWMVLLTIGMFAGGLAWYWAFSRANRNI
jgi:drug/metabolite transporter (DMT)-like permease